MTSTQESGQPISLMGQAVEQAEASLTSLLIGILAESGTTCRGSTSACSELTAIGGEATRKAYEHDLSNWLELDSPAADRMAGDLVTGQPGLSCGTEDGTMGLTEQGRGLREGDSDRLYEDHRTDAGHNGRDDLEQRRTLDDITRRAPGIPARPTTTEDLR